MSANTNNVDQHGALPNCTHTAESADQQQEYTDSYQKRGRRHKVVIDEQLKVRVNRLNRHSSADDHDRSQLEGFGIGSSGRTIIETNCVSREGAADFDHTMKSLLCHRYLSDYSC